jgi:hypothetical protein
MSIFTNLQSFRILAIWVVFLILPIFTSCSTEYTGQYFSFPPGSKPHENNWEYKAVVIVSSKEKPITKKSKKNVQIKVYDKSETLILNDEFDFVRASIDAKVVWEKFEKIDMELIEVGNEYSNDPYNTDLMKSGPNRLVKLIYEYDPQDKKFKRRN